MDDALGADALGVSGRGVHTVDIEAAHEAGLPVFVYTINEPEHFEAEPLLKSVLQNALGDALVGALAGGGLGSIPLPTIDLSDALGLPPGSALIEIQPQTATRVDGTTVIGGTF